MSQRLQLLLIGSSVVLAGCATSGDGVRQPKTLLKWSTPEKPEADKETDKGDDKKSDDKEDEKKPTAARSAADAEPVPQQNAARPAEPEPDPRAEPIVTDRPDFTEASSTVGKGRVQLETGYTHVRDRSDGVLRSAHSYPEALLRVGLFADWFEFRLGQNVGTERNTPGDGAKFVTGFDDLYAGAKLGLTEQAGVLPESALVVQATVPTGAGSRSAGRVLPGVNLLYGWDVIEDKITLGGSSQGLSTVDDNRHTYLTLAQSLTVGYTLTERVGAYTEWFAFFPSGATAPGVGPEHYFNGGFTFRPVPYLQLDVRAGVGLNRRADDFFAGSGVSVRY